MLKVYISLVIGDEFIAKGKAENMKYDDNLDEEKDYDSLKKKIIETGDASEALMSFLGIITFIIVIYCNYNLFY